MIQFVRRIGREPLLLLAVLWPLALLAPFAPGLPRATNSGLTWRQETVIALLVSATLGMLAKRLWKLKTLSLPRERSLLLPLMAMAAFVLWSASSVLWAANVFAAFHYTLSWSLYLLFFLFACRVASQPRLMRASLTTLALVILVISLSNVIGYWTTPNSLLRQNGLGEPDTILIPLFAALALTLRRRRAALLCGTTALVSWLAMLQIAERAYFIGAVTGLALLTLTMCAAKRLRPLSLRRAGLLAAAFVCITAFQVMPSPFVKSAHQPIFARLSTSSADEANIKARFLYWGVALEMLREHPLNGVGAGSYDAVFAGARAQFAARHTGSPLIGINDRYLSVGAHNEYLQIMAELGVPGFALFFAFCLALMWASLRALRRARGTLVPGAVASVMTFAVISGASPLSFRWMGSGLVFFFVAAIFVARSRVKASDAAPRLHPTFNLTPALMRAVLAASFVFPLAIAAAMCAHATNVLQLARAQQSGDKIEAENLYRAALNSNPFDPATHFNFGMWLYGERRDREALEHLRYANERGFATSTCYVYLARAEEGAGDLQAAEETLRRGVAVYPQSVFLNVRHAAALARVGKTAEADVAFSRALLLNSRTARGWYELINHDIDAAIIAARQDRQIAMPGELQPEEGVLAVIDENERRLGVQVSATGWRARMRSAVAR